jgi:Tfp pilus assembly pilus retraction ATPase PilT
MPDFLPVDDLHVDELLKLCVNKHGSDLHVSGGSPPIVRVDGQLLHTG